MCFAFTVVSHSHFMDLCTEGNFLQQQGDRRLAEPPHRGLRRRISLASLLIRAEGNLSCSAQSSPAWPLFVWHTSACSDLPAGALVLLHGWRMHISRLLQEIRPEHICSGTSSLSCFSFLVRCSSYLLWQPEIKL